MKRRTFIRIVGTSALGLPFMYSQFKPTASKPGSATRGNDQRVPLHLGFSAEENGVISVLRHRSTAVCLVGGGVLTKAGKRTLPYVNLVTESREFGTLKNDLFAFGVEPISTPHLPSHFIKFVYGGKPFSVLNMRLEEFLRQNNFGQRVRLLPLAHNFLVYATDGEWAFDPYGALESRVPGGARFRIRLLEEPTHPVAGLELCLAVAFDTALLGLEAPAGHAGLERRVLTATVNDANAATMVFHQVLSFFPDLLELKGWEVARKYLASPLCVSAAARGPGIDLKRAEASLQQLARRGSEVSSAHLIAAINREVQNLENRPGFGTGLPDYLAANKLAPRRTDLMAEALRTKSLA